MWHCIREAGAGRSNLLTPTNLFKCLRFLVDSRFSQLSTVSTNGSSLLTLFLAEYADDTSPFARYLRIVFLESHVYHSLISPAVLSHEKGYTWVIFRCK